MADLREFQLEGAKRIVNRLTDPTGSRRFLLADEVGLGKTLVAKEVVDRLRQEPNLRRGFTVVYICSNTEIADQNRAKLCDEKDCAMPGRLTLLSLQSLEIGRQREKGMLQVFAFTPGTSLQIEHGTGIAKERRLLLYLVSRIWRKPVKQAKWRDFFRCSAGREGWQEGTRPRSLVNEFFRKIAGQLRTRLKDQWESQNVGLLDPHTGKEDGKRRLVDCIEECVQALDPDTKSGVFSRKNRNRIIGELRKGLAHVSLGFLEPNLTILDEFQRFSTILLESQDKKSIVGRLFAKGGSAILILSATPYRMYTLSHENEDHHQDFLKTLAFLRNEAVDSPGLVKLQMDLRAFRERLHLGDWTKAEDPELSRLRVELESCLKEVMCRTERNWHLEDTAKGVQEVTPAGVLPQKTELIEYVQLRRFLLGQKIGDWNITDFWKSSPSALSFMDSHYSLTSRIRRGNKLRLPMKVLRPNAQLPQLSKDNAKFRLLFEKVFAEKKPGVSASSWKFLWVKPTYTYYQDTFYGDCEPAKFLIFSHWRFVPKAISILTSHEALRRIGRTRQKNQSTPLQFREAVSFYVFDTCYPSVALARCISQLQLPGNRDALPTGKQMFAAARRRILDLLKRSGVQKGKIRSAPLWKIMARVEARSGCRKEITAAFEYSKRWKSGETSEHLPRHSRQYLQWLEEGSQVDDRVKLTISSEWIDRLTQIALYSPAVSLMRSFLSVLPQAEESLEHWGEVLKFCLGPLRHYFNKRLVQTIIRRHGSGDSYGGKILVYCRNAHFQSVMDEYAYLVHHVLQQKNAKDFLNHIGRAMGMWSGSPAVNDRTKSGQMSRRPKPQPAHFALAFGDDVSNENTEGDGKTRKSEVREAFNSPFWPFVLATTSVGQEGLDFHLYCRDILHWNLPSNPVDLEQREGRINRYDGFSIRRNIAGDLPLADVLPEEAGSLGNIWSLIFGMLTRGNPQDAKFKHGLFPHWIYQAKHATNGNRTNLAERPIIRRHLLFYRSSKDHKRYADLKDALYLYRLVFGQPRQQDILEKVFAHRPSERPEDLNQSLAKYMINLSPLSPVHAFSDVHAPVSN